MANFSINLHTFFIGPISDKLVPQRVSTFTTRNLFKNFDKTQFAMIDLEFDGGGQTFKAVHWEDS